MSIYCALIHNNSTVKHIYIKYVFLLHGASSLAVLYGSGLHQSPSGEYKTQLYPLLLLWERTSPWPPPSSCIYTLPKPCQRRAQVRGWPCTPVGLWVLRDPARAGGGQGGASRRGPVTGTMSTSSDAPGASRKQDAPSIWEGGKEICLSWLCREGWLGLKYIMQMCIFKVTVVHMWHVCQTITENKTRMSFRQFENYVCGMYIFCQCPLLSHA